MDTIGEIKYEIKMLTKCFEKLEEACECLLDVDDTDKIYEEIHYLIEKVIELKSDKKNKIERICG